MLDCFVLNGWHDVACGQLLSCERKLDDQGGMRKKKIQFKKSDTFFHIYGAMLEFHIIVEECF